MRNRLNVLVLVQYFPPDMGGGSTRASNVVKGLLSKGCEVKVVAAFPHYPHGNVPAKYRGKPIVSEMFNGARVLRVWIPSLPHSSVVNRVVLHLCFVFSSLFALPFVGGVDVVWVLDAADLLCGTSHNNEYGISFDSGHIIWIFCFVNGYNIICNFEASKKNK